MLSSGRKTMTPTKIEQLEQLSAKYYQVRTALQSHPDYGRIPQMLQTQLPADLSLMIKDYEAVRQALVQEKIPVPNIVPMFKQLYSLEQLTIASQAEDNGAKKTPNGWFDYYSKLSDGGIMASASDLYQNWKLLKQLSGSGNPEKVKRFSELVSGFRDDFDWPGKSNYLVGGTRLEYKADSLETTLIQHYNCKKPELVKTTSLEVPEYLGVSIVEVTGTDQGLNYLQTLFDTEDTAEEIIGTLEFISSKDKNNIKIWTPPINSERYYTRKQYPNRAAGFNYDSDSFHVVGSSIDNLGRSLRVDVEAPARAR